MKKKYILISALALGLSFNLNAQSHLRAPNSYIFDVNKPEGVKGLKIPVQKAYDAWQQQEYLRTNNQPTVLPTGAEAVGLVWEDVPGLIRSLTLEGSGSNAKIKVEVNRAKGKGNALVSYKINNEIFWSWHIWITDDPTVETVTYNNGLRLADLNGGRAHHEFMDRNLGA
ncbi:MAG: hypothetical protein Q4G16_07770, partial [Cruoricaptor ignavus]|nr:hypothetical protein [Cruoricaptor ignavus]